jgi:hypothetical protein
MQAGLSPSNLVRVLSGFYPQILAAMDLRLHAAGVLPEAQIE